MKEITHHEITLNGVVYIRKDCVLTSNCGCNNQFPFCNDQFGVKNKGNDRSYSGDAFKCVASDNFKIVATRIGGGKYGCVNHYVFDRSVWDFQKLSGCVLAAMAAN